MPVGGMWWRKRPTRRERAEYERLLKHLRLLPKAARIIAKRRTRGVR